MQNASLFAIMLKGEHWYGFLEDAHGMSAEPWLPDVKAEDVHSIFPPEGNLLWPLCFRLLASIVPHTLSKCYTGFTASVQGTVPQWYCTHALHF